MTSVTFPSDQNRRPSACCFALLVGFLCSVGRVFPSSERATSRVRRRAQFFPSRVHPSALVFAAVSSALCRLFRSSASYDARAPQVRLSGVERCSLLSISAVFDRPSALVVREVRPSRPAHQAAPDHRPRSFCSSSKELSRTAARSYSSDPPIGHSPGHLRKATTPCPTYRALHRTTSPVRPPSPRPHRRTPPEYRSPASP